MNKLLNTKQNQIAVPNQKEVSNPKGSCKSRGKDEGSSKDNCIDIRPYFNHSLPPLATLCWVFNGMLDE